MGMFDNLICKAPLPLNEKATKLNIDWANEVFQTKCLDNIMTTYEITNDGELVEDVVEYDYTLYSKRELETLKPKPWSLIKDSVVKNKYKRAAKHHGTVVFYTSVEYTEDKDLWVEFEACFIYGKLDKINLIKIEEQRSQKVICAEWQTIREAEAKQPWNRFKQKVRPLGWRWFWRKTARMMHFTSKLTGTLEFKIHKHLL
jgi:hypothetical protein